jgi:arylsulfatase A-like enzyme
VRFTDFYVAAPVCTPSRYALLTGKQPFRSDGLTTALMPSDRHGLDREETTIAEVLQGAGYRTACIGKWHLGRLDPAYHPCHHGFDRFYGFQGGLVDYYRHAYAAEPDWWRDTDPLIEEGYVTDLLTDEACRFIRSAGEAPFFLFLSYSAPHYARDREGNIILQGRVSDAGAFPGITDPKRREYAAMVRALDEGVERVVRTVAESGLSEETLVLFISDNGPELAWGGTCHPLRGAKRSLYEGGIRVPAIAAWPGRIEAGRVVDRPCSTLDLFPSFCGLAGADGGGSPLDGDDIMPVLLGGAGPDRDLLWRYGNTDAIRRGNWKLVRRNGVSELYDLAGDPGETTSLAADHPDLSRSLAAVLDNYSL